MDQSSESIDYPITESSDEEELNPFQFNLEQQGMQQSKLDELFGVVLRSEPSQYGRMLKELRRLREFVGNVNKEHEIFLKLKDQYEKLKHKMVNHDQLLVGIEKGYSQEIEELRNEIVELQKESERQREEIGTYQVQITTDQAKIQSQDQQIHALQNQVLNLTKELMTAKKDIHSLKQLKKGRQIESADSIQQFEAIMTSKVREFIIRFLNIDDILSVLRTSKSLYFALSLPKVIMPQIVFCKVEKANKRIAVLSHQLNQFEYLKNNCNQKELQDQIGKYLDSTIQPTELFTPVLQECLNFIEGQQFTSRSSQYESGSVQGLTMFLQQLSQRSMQCIQMLKNQSFEWSSFHQDLVKSSNAQKSNQNVHKTLKTKAQGIQEKLFDLGSIAASDPSMYGTYFAKIQQLFAQLFVYTNHLIIEFKQLQGLTYYLVVQYWVLAEKDKKVEEQVEDIKHELQATLTSRQYLNESLKSAERRVQESESREYEARRRLMVEVQQKEVLVKRMEETQRQLKNYSQNVKLLAIELKKERGKKKKIIEEYNLLGAKFEALRAAIREV